MHPLYLRLILLILVLLRPAAPSRRNRIILYQAAARADLPIYDRLPAAFYSLRASLDLCLIVILFSSRIPPRRRPVDSLFYGSSRKSRRERTAPLAKLYSASPLLIAPWDAMTRLPSSEKLGKFNFLSVILRNRCWLLAPEGFIRTHLDRVCY